MHESVFFTNGELIRTRKLVPAPASSKKNLAPVIDLTKDDEVNVPDEPPPPSPILTAGPSNIFDAKESKGLFSFDTVSQNGFRILSPMKQESLQLVPDASGHTPALHQTQPPVAAGASANGLSAEQVRLDQFRNSPDDGPKAEETAVPQTQTTPAHPELVGQPLAPGDPMEIDQPLPQPSEIAVKYGHLCSLLKLSLIYNH